MDGKCERRPDDAPACEQPPRLHGVQPAKIGEGQRITPYSRPRQEENATFPLCFFRHMPFSQAACRRCRHGLPGPDGRLLTAPLQSVPGPSASTGTAPAAEAAVMRPDPGRQRLFPVLRVWLCAAGKPVRTLRISRILRPFCARACPPARLPDASPQPCPRKG